MQLLPAVRKPETIIKVTGRVVIHECVESPYSLWVPFDVLAARYEERVLPGPDFRSDSLEVSATVYTRVPYPMPEARFETWRLVGWLNVYPTSENWYRVEEAPWIETLQFDNNTT